MKVGQTLSGTMPGKGGARFPSLPGGADMTARLTAHSSNAGARRSTLHLPDHAVHTGRAGPDGGDSPQTGRME
jgi:hypothetical protein